MSPFTPHRGERILWAPKILWSVLTRARPTIVVAG